MKLRLAAATLLALCSFSHANAADLMTKTGTETTASDFGIGVAISRLMGVSLYAGINNGNFLQSSVGFGGGGDFAVSADYGVGYPRAFSLASSLTPYWGVGALVLHDDRTTVTNEEITTTETRVGARIPLGLAFVIPRTPVQLGVELVPTVIPAPVTYSFVDAGLNARVLF